MGKQKTAAELKAENRVLRRTIWSDRISITINSLVKWGALVLIFRYLYLIIKVLAGQKTMASIGVSFLGDFRVSETIAWIFGSGGIAYGWNQRKLRGDTIQRLTPRLSDFEKSLDPARSSSHLTSRGKTRPEDL